jgi:2-dehydropantoate 2-reductase
MSEVILAAAKFGYTVPQSFAEQQVSITYPMGAYKPSSLIDYLAGRAVEVEAIWGEPLRRAEAVGVNMPRLTDLYQRLKQLTAKTDLGRTGADNLGA